MKKRKRFYSGLLIVLVILFSSGCQKKAAVTVADKLIKNENVEKNIIIEGRYCTTDTIKESQEHIWGTK